ncbi:hypothetical protein HMPREF2531_04055 [Bacteroides intestinalis]|uniref:Uncharacterized protein n=1 Tax=Bacteroides intestinalis TaxID=329854 RepID=A0A139KY66_9BACE|nr:hypothetical protein HMPREF2531_04055 [Bacteroides intestinalis]
MKSKKFHLKFLGIFTSERYRTIGTLPKMFYIENKNRSKPFCVQNKNVLFRMGIKLRI